MLCFKDSICENIHSSMLREWIETNGMGSYCSSTIIGLNTRRYHGLLVTSLNPPVNRYVMVSKAEETVVIRGDKYSLSCNQYPDKIFPDGNKYLKEFRLTPFPKFIYEIDRYRIEKTVFMPHGKNATVIKYSVFPNKGDVDIYIRPMLGFRYFHGLRSGNDSIVENISVKRKSVLIVPKSSSLPPLYIYHCADVFHEREFWYNNFEYREEAYRGFDCHEDLYNPGYLIYTFSNHKKYDAWVVFSNEPLIDIDVNSWQDKEIHRRSNLLKNIPVNNHFIEPLILASDSFIVQKNDTPNSTILAGYHWFGDWTRDTMISLPGLTLATGRFDVAKQILHKTIQSLDNGLLPNYFDDNNQPIFNSVDASLWYFYALYKYLQYTNDISFAKTLVPYLKQIVESYQTGTRFGIKMNDLNLIEFDENKLPLTWMDTVGTHTHAPTRRGMVVEVNALWYQAIKILEYIMTKNDCLSDALKYASMAKTISTNFGKVFWNNKTKYLYDFVYNGYKENTLRPNQILAIGLPFSVLQKKYWSPIINIVTEKLYTPFGLRSLSPDDPYFYSHYRGGERKRNAAYHQGTAWTWLLGFYISSLTKLQGKTQKNTTLIKSLLKPFRNIILVGGLGTLSEIYDGNLPYYFRGCISQAWSVAEILRVYNEEILCGQKLKPIAKKKQTINV